MPKNRWYESLIFSFLFDKILGMVVEGLNKSWFIREAKESVPAFVNSVG
jgi:hypothetical protein